MKYRFVAACALSLVGSLAVLRCDPFEGAPVLADAAVADSALIDATGLPDAEPMDASSSCQEAMGPERVCFNHPNPACPIDSEVSTQLALAGGQAGVPLDAGALDLRYPHGLAIAGQWVYFAVQRHVETDAGNPPGRNRGDLGAIYRWNPDVGGSLERVTGLLDAPEYLVASSRALFYRAREDKDWVVRKLELDTVGACRPTCGGTYQARHVGAEIERIVLVEPDAAPWYRAGGALYRVSGNTSEMVRGPNPTAALTHLGIGRRPTWSESASIWEIRGGERLDASLSPIFVTDAGAAEAGLPFGFHVYGACATTYVYDDNFNTADGTRPLQRVTPTGYESIVCGTACSPSLTFELAADRTHLYVARPNQQGLQALSRAGGTPQLLVPGGDIWNVAVDDRNVYFADINGKRVGRIKKR